MGVAVLCTFFHKISRLGVRARARGSNRVSDSLCFHLEKSRFLFSTRKIAFLIVFLFPTTNRVCDSGYNKLNARRFAAPYQPHEGLMSIFFSWYRNGKWIVFKWEFPENHKKTFCKNYKIDYYFSVAAPQQTITTLAAAYI